MAYTGVLKFRGKRKEEAIEFVRSTEEQIIDGLYDADLLTTEKFMKEKDALHDESVIRERAERFIKLFRTTIPKDHLPPRKKPSKANTSQQSIEQQPAVQDNEFHVNLDIDETIRVNGKVPKFTGSQDTIFRLLVEEAVKGSDPVPSSYIKATSAWKGYIEGEEERSDQLFVSGMRSLRTTLEELGLGNMLKKIGRTKGTTYQLQLDSFTNEAEPTPPEPQPAEIKLSEPELRQPQRLRYYEQQVEETQSRTPQTVTRDFYTRARRFDRDLVNWIAKLETDSDYAGVRRSIIVQQMVNVLGISSDEALDTLRNLRQAERLFVVSKIKGSPYDSVSRPEARMDTDRPARNSLSSKETEADRIKRLKEEHGTSILAFLNTMQPGRTEFKTAIASAVGLSVDDINPICSLLKAEGKVYSKAEKARGSSRARKGKTWGLSSEGRQYLLESEERQREAVAQLKTIAEYTK